MQTSLLRGAALWLGLAVCPWPAAQARAEPAAAPAAGVPVPPPLPPERPPELKPPEPPGATVTAPPLPPQRPAELASPEAPSVPAGPTPAAEGANPPIVSPPLPPAPPPELSGEAALALTVTPPDDTACRTRLKRLGVAFEPLPPIANGQCAAVAPLKISALGEGVALPQSATLVCGAAEALARWATEVQVVAEKELGKPLSGLVIGTSYECRGQNHDADARLSEHAFANGADVMSFTFSGRPPVPVGRPPEGSPEAKFLGSVRARACGFFRTVLGPGSDAAHANHFHLDERERNAGHRLCQ